MKKLKILTMVAFIGCLPEASPSAQAANMNIGGASGDIPMWIKPMSMDEVRAQRAKRKAAMASGNMPTSGGKPKWQSEAKDSKKKKGGASSYMRRMYYIHSGNFPKLTGKMNPPQTGDMSHGSMMPHGTMPGMKNTVGAALSGSHKNKNPNAKTVLWVESPDNSIKSFTVKQRGNALLASFPAGYGGWYKLYAYNDLGVRNGSRIHLISHQSFFSHGEHPDELDAPTIEGPGYFQGRPVLELERICPNHNECFRTATGQNLRVRVLLKGRPLIDTPLVLTTEQGWVQTNRTDAHGIVSFSIIKESFPEEVDRRKAEDYLLTLDYMTNEMGMWNGEHFHGERYVATLPMRVYPSPLDWESRSVAFQVLIGTILVVGGAIAIRRKRRRPKT